MCMNQDSITGNSRLQCLWDKGERARTCRSGSRRTSKSLHKSPHRLSVFLHAILLHSQVMLDTMRMSRHHKQDEPTPADEDIVLEVEAGMQRVI